MRWLLLLLLVPLAVDAHETLTGSQIASRTQAERSHSKKETVRYKCGYAGRYSNCWKNAVAAGLPITLSDLESDEAKERLAKFRKDQAKRDERRAKRAAEIEKARATQARIEAQIIEQGWEHERLSGFTVTERINKARENYKAQTGEDYRP